jgi:hypothetical protein
MNDETFVSIQPNCWIKFSLDSILKVGHDIVLNDILKRRPFQRVIGRAFDFAYNHFFKSLVCIAGTTAAALKPGQAVYFLKLIGT